MKTSTRIFLLAGMLASHVVYSQPLYTVTDLGEGAAYAINNAGQVTGFLRNGPNANAFIYSNGVTTELGTLGGSTSFGLSINNLGQVAGYSYLAGNNQAEAFIYSGGMLTGIGVYGDAFGINDSGQISGNSNFNAYLYSNGVKTNLGTFGSWGSEAHGINNLGQVTGYSWVAYGGIAHAFIYDNGVMSDIGTLGGGLSIGFDINDSGQVTGQSDLGNGAPYHAFLYTNGVMNDIGTLGGSSSYGYAINSHGDVTGSASTTGNSALHAFVFSDGFMSDLNSLIDPQSGWELMRSDGINDAGQIVGWGNFNGANHAFLLTPITEAVPEPSTWALLLIGLGLLAGVTRRA